MNISANMYSALMLRNASARRSRAGRDSRSHRGRRRRSGSPRPARRRSSCRGSPLAPPSPAAVWSPARRGPAALGQRLAPDLAGHPSLAEHQHAVAQRHQFLGVRRAQQHRAPRRARGQRSARRWPPWRRRRRPGWARRAAARRGLGAQPLGEHDLLLVAAAEQLQRPLGVGRAQPDGRPSAASRPARRRRGSRRAAAAAARSAGSVRFSRTLIAITAPCALAVGGHEGRCPLSIAADHVPGRQRSPATVDPPPARRSAPNSSGASSSRPEPSMPPTPTISPGPQLERQVVQRRAAEPVDGQHDRSPVAARLAARAVGDGVPTISVTIASWSSPPPAALGDHPAVAQHHDPVGEVEDLVEPVGDEDARPAPVAATRRIASNSR